MIEREGELSGPREILRQLRRTPSPPASPKLDKEPEDPEVSTNSKKKKNEAPKPFKPSAAGRVVPTGWKEPQVRVYASSLDCDLPLITTSVI